MSSQQQQLPTRPKRKHSTEETEMVQKLRKWKKRELSEDSHEMADTLLETTTKSPNNVLLKSSFEFFTAKQKQKEQAEVNSKALVNRIQDLEEQLQLAKSQLEESRAKEQEAKAEIMNIQIMLEYGDWYRDLLKAVLLRAEVEIHSDTLEAAAIAKAAAENRPFHSLSPEDREIINQEKRTIQSRARQIESILHWRENGQNESAAPGTPFLDRIECICAEAGITRVQCLDWINEYSERNEKCHNPPPQLSQFWKKTQAGEDVKVSNHEDAYNAIDWVAMKASIDNYKASIQAKFANGSLTEVKKVYIIELVDQFWKFHSDSTDTEGNPIASDFARNEAKKYSEQRSNVNKTPSEDYLKNYHVGKWDDLI
ncbi:hypothetical protein FGRMN_6455 [Fusarium graminum]|nr:hypothetical protein FGRMN_6455 [Fusarium graminum]